MEGDTARIYRLEREMKKTNQSIVELASAINQVRKEVSSTFTLLFMYTTLLCLSLTGFVMLK